jgi:hypothetical protein
MLQDQCAHFFNSTHLALFFRLCKDYGEFQGEMLQEIMNEGGIVPYEITIGARVLHQQWMPLLQL